MDTAPSSTTTAADPIVCRVTVWYFRRMALLAGMLLLMGLYFLYDGKFGYPKANGIAEKKDWFEQVLLKGYDEAKKEGTLDAWIAQTKAQGWPTGRDGEPPRWISYAAEKGWPEKPHKYTAKEISEQFWWGGGVLAVALGVGVLALLNRGKVLRAGADHFITPEGRTVRFAEVFRVDKRKWDNKGLAYVWHRPAAEAPEQRAEIDDLKYDGAVKVLDRLLVNFKGELIEKVADSAAELPETDEKKA